jgi:hypothetical protein
MGAAEYRYTASVLKSTTVPTVCLPKPEDYDAFDEATASCSYPNQRRRPRCMVRSDDRAQCHGVIWRSRSCFCRTIRKVCVRLVARISRPNSDGVATGLPSTAMIMSPARSPAFAAAEFASTDITKTPRPSFTPKYSRNCGVKSCTWTPSLCVAETEAWILMLGIR